MLNRNLATAVSYFLCVVGLSDTAVMSYAEYHRLDLPCTVSGGCEIVWKSAISHPLGVPLPYIGFVAYIALTAMVVLHFRDRSDRWMKRANIVALGGAAVSLGLTAYSTQILGVRCPWCIASALTMCLLALVTSLSVRHSVEPGHRAMRSGLVIALSCIPIAIALGSTAIADRFVMQSPSIQFTASRHPRPDELNPPQTVAFNPSGNRGSLTMFLDLKCGTCHAIFPEVVRYAKAAQLVLYIRHNPSAMHEGAHQLALNAEVANERGYGSRYVENAVTGDGNEAGLDPRPSPHEIELATSRLDVDVDFLRRYGLSGTPVLILSLDKSLPRVISLREFHAMEDADPRKSGEAAS